MSIFYIVPYINLKLKFYVILKMPSIVINLCSFLKILCKMIVPLSTVFNNMVVLDHFAFI